MAVIRSALERHFSWVPTTESEMFAWLNKKTVNTIQLKSNTLSGSKLDWVLTHVDKPLAGPDNSSF